MGVENPSGSQSAVPHWHPTLPPLNLTGPGSVRTTDQFIPAEVMVPKSESGTHPPEQTHLGSDSLGTVPGGFGVAHPTLRPLGFPISSF